MTPESDRSMDEIEIEIARTRARLSTTTDTLAAELAPPRLIHQGADMLNGFLAGPMGSSSAAAFAPIPWPWRCSG